MVTLHRASTKLLKLNLQETEEGEGEEQEDDDDGWGSNDDNMDVSTMIKASNNKNSVNIAKQEKNDRDLFIPIFAIVSLLGLFGSYAYEMIRLASRGELYLPWNN